MPADRVFGIVEKELRRVATITSPATYDSQLSKFGTLHTLFDDVHLFDWQNLSKAVVQTKKTFKISFQSLFDGFAVVNLFHF